MVCMLCAVVDSSVGLQAQSTCILPRVCVALGVVGRLCLLVFASCCLACAICVSVVSVLALYALQVS